MRNRLLAVAAAFFSLAGVAHANGDREYVYAVSDLRLTGTLTVTTADGSRVDATTTVHEGWPHASKTGAYAFYFSPVRRPPLAGRLWGGHTHARWTGQGTRPDGRVCPLSFSVGEPVRGDWRPHTDQLMLELPNIGANSRFACGVEFDGIYFSSYGVIDPQPVRVTDAEMREIRPHIDIDVTTTGGWKETKATLRWQGRILLRRVHACRSHVGIGCVTSFLR
jgi:hypothetical protein